MNCLPIRASELSSGLTSADVDAFFSPYIRTTGDCNARCGRMHGLVRDAKGAARDTGCDRADRLIRAPSASAGLATVDGGATYERRQAIQENQERRVSGAPGHRPAVESLASIEISPPVPRRSASFREAAVNHRGCVSDIIRRMPRTDLHGI